MSKQYNKGQANKATTETTQPAEGANKSKRHYHGKRKNIQAKQPVEPVKKVGFFKKLWLKIKRFFSWSN
jgi:hypothetical protein